MGLQTNLHKVILLYFLHYNWHNDWKRSQKVIFYLINKTVIIYMYNTCIITSQVDFTRHHTIM